MDVFEKEGDAYGCSGGRQADFEEAASLRELRVGSASYRRGFPFEMRRLRTPDYEPEKSG